MLHKTLIILTLTTMAITTATQAMASPCNVQKSQVPSSDHLQLGDTTQPDLSSIICPQAREADESDIKRPPRS